MIKNKEHIEKERELYLRVMLHPNNDGKVKYKFTDVPFPKIAKEEKKPFNREQAWKEAPEYNLDKIGNFNII